MALPAIALAYLSFVAGLLTSFAGLAWIAVAVSIAGSTIAFLRRDTALCALSLVVLAGAVIAVTEPPRARKRFDREPESRLEVLRERAARSIDRVFREDAPMARALLIADQHRISPEMKDRYARAGMIHMLSISGLHVAIIAGAVALALQAVRAPPGAVSLLSVCITALYVAIIGAPPPAVRSAVMLGGVALSRMSQRPTSPWAGLALGALVPLASPRTVLDLGYQLSVIGIAGLIASAMLARRLLRSRASGWKLHVSKELLTSAVATAVTAPIVAWYFGRLSIIAPLANLAAAPVLSVLQPLLFLALVLSPLEPVARFAADAAHPLLLIFDKVAVVAAAIPLSSIAVTPGLLAAIAAGGAVVFAIVAASSRYPARPLVAGCACLTVVVVGPSSPLLHRGEVELHFLDVGQGDAILLRTDKGRWVLFDAGRMWRTGDAGRSTIIPYVKSRGGEVRALILSHAHADHLGGAISVVRALKPREFWDSAFPQGSMVYDMTLRAVRDAGVKWNRVRAGDLMVVDGVTVRFLAPDSAWTASLSDPNEASTVALVEYGSTRFLLVGDAEREEEEWLIARSRNDLAAHVLKVGHHGSATSSTDAFLAAVNPLVAVISVGADNRYGHPSADVIAALGRLGTRTLRTDREGTIVIRTDGSRIRVEDTGEVWDISRN